MAGEPALLTPWQHIAPPGIFERGCHVVRHYVEHEANAFGLQRLVQAFKTLTATKSGIEAVVIDHVVAVGRACRGLIDRRSIEMTDAEACQIGHQIGGAVEVHAVAELEPISGGGWVHGRGRSSRIALERDRNSGSSRISSSVSGKTRRQLGNS